MRLRPEYSDLWAQTAISPWLIKARRFDASLRLLHPPPATQGRRQKMRNANGRPTALYLLLLLSAITVSTNLAAILTWIFLLYSLRHSRLRCAPGWLYARNDLAKWYPCPSANARLLAGSGTILMPFRRSQVLNSFARPSFFSLFEILPFLPFCHDLLCFLAIFPVLFSLFNFVRFFDFWVSLRS